MAALTIPDRRAADCLAGGGELGALMRAFDWASTPLGQPEDWPQSLKTAVRIMLTSRQPMWIGWGKDLTYLYNDAYKSIIGGKHPWALGRPTRVVWREIWNDIGPMLATAMTGVEGTYVEAQLLIMERNGYPEETYYTFSYSPIPDDSGNPGGIICANTDDTQRVIGERQLALLRELAARTADARTWQEACARSAEALLTNPRDLPFALLYMAEPESRTLSLAGSCAIAPGHPAAPETVAADGASPWPWAEVLRQHELRVVSGLAAMFGADLPAGAWKRRPDRAAVLPIPTTGETGRAGILIVGLNPYRLFDESYRGFLGLMAGQISAALANAQAYQEERRRAEALAEIDRAKTVFFSNVSHELRTPLTLMLGPLEDVMAKPDAEIPPDDRALVILAHRNGLRLLKLVNSLLDFSRIEAGRVQASYEPVDLAALTAELASNFRSACDKAGLALAVDCPPVGAPAYVDRDMWEKIVLNLVSNAFKFTLAGGITVALRRTGGEIALSVHDTGTGIPAHEIPHLFERFHRIEGAEGRTQEGTGIGLALVQELVKLHGGTVRADSVPGEGSTFTVAIPLGTAHLPKDRIRAASTLASTALGAQPFLEEALRWLPGEDGVERAEADIERTLLTEPSLPLPAGAANDRPTILLADDNADMRDYLRRLLGVRYHVRTAADGEKALAALRERRPDLLLSDVMMPRIDGYALVRELRADPALADLPVILLSARAGEEASIEGLDAGADDYLVKPFSARELVARVHANLQMAQVRKAAQEAVRRRTIELETVLETVPTAVWFTDDPMAARAVGNRYAARLLRLSPAANVSLSAPAAERPSYRAFRNGIEVPAEALPLQRAARGEDVPDEELEIRFAEGDAATLLIRAAPLRGTAGEVRGAVCAASDITERKRAEEAVAASEQRLAIELAATRRLQEISTLLIREGDSDALYRHILDAAIELMRSDMASLQMLDHERGELRLLAWRGFDAASAACWERVRAGSGSTCGVALASGRRIVVPDIDACEFMADAGSLDAYRQAGIGAAQSTPLVSRSGRVVGMISTHWRAPHQPAERDLRLFDVLARQVADLIERAQAEAALRDLNTTLEARVARA
ncbi:MAG TPA: ATP-binding protein [Stellaceae bacterium]|nr:ATP-binding protein [Stellaceae bacterium]